MAAPDLIGERLAASRDKFLAFVRARVDDDQLADDVLQEGLLKALRAAPSLQDEGALAPWFYRILQNGIVDTYRRRGLERAHTAGPPSDDLALEEETQAALCRCFYDLLPALKPEYAQLIRALDLEGKPADAAARELGISPNNLKVRHHRARQALRRRLEEVCRVCADHHCLDCSCQTAARL